MTASPPRLLAAPSGRPLQGRSRARFWAVARRWSQRDPTSPPFPQGHLRADRLIVAGSLRQRSGVRTARV